VVDILKVALEEIQRRYPKVWAVYLFGSSATEFETQNSDLDLAILIEDKADIVSLWDLSQTIAIKINRDVDLVDLRQASTVFQKEILIRDKRILCRNPKECTLLESQYLSMYLHLNEERKELLKDFREVSHD
jgi:predicted nucleotidyltransferase